MSTETKMRWAFVGCPLAGLASALLPVFVNFKGLLGAGTTSVVLVVAMFGIFNGICFYLFLDLRSIWRIGGFIVASIAAFYASIFAAFWAYQNLSLLLDRFRTRTPQIGAETFFVGGFTGAFIISTAALLLLSPGRKVSNTLFKSFLGALVGGLLGVAGPTAAPFVYRVRLLLPHMTFYGGDSDISLFVVWQTGMALVLALILWSEKKRHETASQAAA